MTSTPAPDGAAVLLTTLGDRAQAEHLAREIVREGLAACVTLVPGATSIYRWKDQVVTESEIVLLMKTPRDRVAPLKERLSKRHPYELPEILVIEVGEGSPEYMAWLRAETRSPLEG